MLVTLLGMAMLVRLEHSLNAQSPMLVTLLGIVTLVSPEQNSNAYSPMLVTLQVTPLCSMVSGMTMLPE